MTANEKLLKVKTSEPVEPRNLAGATLRGQPSPANAAKESLEGRERWVFKIRSRHNRKCRCSGRLLAKAPLKALPFLSMSSRPSPAGLTFNEARRLGV